MSLFKFTKNILENKKIEIYNKGNHVRDFTYIDDVVNALHKLLNKKPKKVKNSNAKYQVVNIGGSNPITLKKFINEIENQLSKKSIKKFLSLQPGDIIKTSANPNKLKKLTNFKPKIGYKSGIKEFVSGMSITTDKKISFYLKYGRHSASTRERIFRFKHIFKNQFKINYNILIGDNLFVKEFKKGQINISE